MLKSEGAKRLATLTIPNAYLILLTGNFGEGFSMPQDDYFAGRMGAPSTRTDARSVADNIQGQIDASRQLDNERANRLASHGSGDRHTFHMIFLLAFVGLIVFSLKSFGVFALEGGQWVAVWVAASLVSYIILRLLPHWASGGIMGFLTGSVAGYLGWYYGDVFWALGVGIGTAIVMYLIFSQMSKPNATQH